MRPFGDVGSAFAAPSIQAVASGTGRRESLLTPRRDEFGVLLRQILPWRLRPRGKAADGQRAASVSTNCDRRPENILETLAQNSSFKANC